MRASRLALLLLAALGLSSCGPTPQMGGAGAEAGNAITVSVLSPSGKPAAGAMVEIRPTNSVDLAPTFSATTGPDGLARFEPGTTGPWSVLVRKDGMAFWQIADGNGGILDTLRPMGRLAGLLEQLPGHILSIPGLGYQTICDSDGFFVVESLPSGYIPLRNSHRSTTQNLARTLAATKPSDSMFSQSDAFVLLEPGRTTILATRDTILPSNGVVADDFIPWLHLPAPAAFPVGRIPESDDFFFGALLRLDTTRDSVELLKWGTASRGVRFGFRRNGKLFAEVNGDSVPESEFRCGNGGILQVDGTFALPEGTEALLEMRRNPGFSTSSVSITKNDTTCLVLSAADFDDRTGWGSPSFGTNGGVKVIWIANLQAPGQPIPDWLSLARMWQKGY